MQMEVKYTKKERRVGWGSHVHRGGGGAGGGQRQRQRKTVEEMAGGKRVQKK